MCIHYTFLNGRILLNELIKQHSPAGCSHDEGCMRPVCWWPGPGQAMTLPPAPSIAYVCMGISESTPKCKLLLN